MRTIGKMGLTAERYLTFVIVRRFRRHTESNRIESNLKKKGDSDTTDGQNLASFDVVLNSTEIHQIFSTSLSFFSFYIQQRQGERRTCVAVDRVKNKYSDKKTSKLQREKEKEKKSKHNRSHRVDDGNRDKQEHLCTEEVKKNRSLLIHRANNTKKENRMIDFRYQIAEDA